MGLRGDRLKIIREREGISQRDLSKDAGLGEHAVYKMEKNLDDPKISSISKIAEQLDVSLDFLTARTDDPKAHKGASNLTPEEREFLSALRRKDYSAAFDMLNARLKEYLLNKSSVASSKPPTNE